MSGNYCNHSFALSLEGAGSSHLAHSSLSSGSHYHGLGPPLQCASLPKVILSPALQLKGFELFSFPRARPQQVATYDGMEHLRTANPSSEREPSGACVVYAGYSNLAQARLHPQSLHTPELRACLLVQSRLRERYDEQAANHLQPAFFDDSLNPVAASVPQYRCMILVQWSLPSRTMTANFSDEPFFGMRLDTCLTLKTQPLSSLQHMSQGPVLWVPVPANKEGTSSHLTSRCTVDLELDSGGCRLYMRAVVSDRVLGLPGSRCSISGALLCSIFRAAVLAFRHGHR